MRYLSISISVLLAILLPATHAARVKCTHSPKVTPKPQYEFTMNLTLGAGTDLGIDIYNARQTFLPIEGGSFCSKWNGGVTGTVVSGLASYYQTANGTGHIYKLAFEYLLTTNESPPAVILVKQSGWEVNYVGRTTYAFETGDPRYAFVNSGVYVGVETGYAVNGTNTYSSVDGYTLV